MSNLEEITLKKLLNMSKFITIHNKTKKPVKITIEFENTRFGDEGYRGYAVLDLTNKAENSISGASSIVSKISEACDREADRIIKQRLGNDD